MRKPPKPPVKVGEKFGDLTTVKHYYVPRSGNPDNNPTKKQTSKWTCLCVCGKKTEVRQDNLTGGFSKSCGCRRYASAIPRGITFSNRGGINK